MQTGVSTRSSPRGRSVGVSQLSPAAVLIHRGSESWPEGEQLHLDAEDELQAWSAKPSRSAILARLH
jgi:hypothetical protein